MKKRNYTFDILKVMSLLCIVLAHVNPNRFIFQLRNFDVPLMIMISVWLSMKTINNSEFKYLDYIKNRIKRLIVPTWIFLTIYFGIYLLIGRLQSIEIIILSYLLIGGIGYVWVIRIYIYVAIITPVINKIYLKTKKWNFYCIIISQYILYSVLIRITSSFDSRFKLVLTATILDFIGYSFIVYIAVILFNLKNKQKVYLDIIFGIIFLLLAIKYNFSGTQQFKYPIRLYYLSYAFFVGIALYIIIDKINKYKELKLNTIIIFISKNSMWIYLWHILYVSVVNKMFVNISLGYILRFIILIVLAIVTTYMQNIVIYYIKKYSNYINKKQKNCLLK